MNSVIEICTPQHRGGKKNTFPDQPPRIRAVTASLESGKPPRKPEQAGLHPGDFPVLLHRFFFILKGTFLPRVRAGTRVSKAGTKKKNGSGRLRSSADLPDDRGRETAPGVLRSGQRS